LPLRSADDGYCGDRHRGAPWVRHADRNIAFNEERGEKMKERINVKRTGIYLAGFLSILVATSPIAQAQTPSSGWLNGWLTASQIIGTSNVGIGTWMKKLNCLSETDCAQKLVKAGDKYVFVIGKEVYQVSDQKLVAGYAGTNVNIQGVLNPQKKTIEVEDIQGTKSEWMSGYVTASQIAATGTNSIGRWMKKLNCQTETECAQKLAKAGDKYVLMIGEDVYQLSDQERAAVHAGMYVDVRGILNQKRKTIEVDDIEDPQDCGLRMGISNDTSGDHASPV
jgi:hypothetical protein